MNNQRKIIGLCGRQRSGKSTIANYLHNTYNATIISVASSLKELCANITGITIDTLNNYKDKNIPITYTLTNEICQKIANLSGIDINHVIKFKDKVFYSYRKLLQFIGTDIIRSYDSEWHVKKLIENINNTNGDVVIDDIRFPNEREALYKLGGKCLFIIKPNVTDISNHECENSLSWIDFLEKEIVINDMNLDELFKCFDEWYSCDFNYDNKMLLSGNQYYTGKWSKFGLKYDEMTKICFESTKKNDGFSNCIVWFETMDPRLMIDFCLKIMGTLGNAINYQHKIGFYHPLIIENLKMWL